MDIFELPKDYMRYIGRVAESFITTHRMENLRNDIHQEAFAILLRHVRTYGNIGSLAYAGSVVYRGLSNAYVDVNGIGRNPKNAHVVDTLVGRSVTSFESMDLEHIDEHDCLAVRFEDDLIGMMSMRAWIDHLDDESRQLVMMRLNGNKFKDIAEKTSIGLRRLNRKFDKLRADYDAFTGVE